MDKKLIQQFGQDILSYRLRTKRQKIRAQYEDFDKFLIQLYRQERALRKEKYRQFRTCYDPSLEAQIDRIERYLERNHYQGRQWKLVRGYGWELHDRYEKPRYKNPIKNKPVGKILSELEE